MHFLRAAGVARVRGAFERAKRWRQRRAALVRLQARILGLLDRLAAEQPLLLTEMAIDRAGTDGLKMLLHLRRDGEALLRPG
jgi:hypothetical protein